MKNRNKDESSLQRKPERNPDDSPSKVKKSHLAIYGFHPIPAGGAPVTNDMVNELRHESGI